VRQNFQPAACLPPRNPPAAASIPQKSVTHHLKGGGIKICFFYAVMSVLAIAMIADVLNGIGRVINRWREK